MAGNLPTVEITCVQCGGKAIKFRTGGKPARYCSDACKTAAFRVARPDLLEAQRERQASKYVPKVRQPRPKAAPKPRVKHCRDCADVVERSKQRCERCRVKAREITLARVRATPGYQATKRKAKAWRRAVERGCEAERFDPFEIFERDKWRCHLCGCKTLQSLRGTSQDRAPELDHIIPLSKGGQHTRANTACSCRKCNGAKGDRLLGQLRLVA